MKHSTKYCPRCKADKKSRDFYKAASRGDGLQPICKSCSNEYQHSPQFKQYQLNYQRSSKSKEYKKRYNQTPKAKFLLYKRVARKRKHPFKFTFLEFKNFWQQPCYYCGSSIDTIGLDQIIPGKGYVLENVHPCCWACNVMKFDRTEQEFYDHIFKLATHINDRRFAV